LSPDDIGEAADNPVSLVAMKQHQDLIVGIYKSLQIGGRILIHVHDNIHYNLIMRPMGVAALSRERHISI
jgi:hypothetical protein